MKRQKVIHPSEIPTRLPMFSTATIWLLLDRLQLPSWANGAIWAVWGVLCAGLVIMFFTQKCTHIFDEEKP